MNIVRTVFLLLASNVYKTFSWYGPFKLKTSPLWIAIDA